MKKNTFIGLFLIFSFHFVLADISQFQAIHELSASHEDFNYPDYFLIKNDPRAAIVDLINFEHVMKDFPMPSVRYDRLQHFGTWINYPGDQLCQNTRAKVLVRESKTAVTFSANGCTIKSGQWNDPYTDVNFESATTIQIDHLVPLKNAYMTGAHEWSQSKRCLYANYLGNNFHLIPVSGKENVKKGDNTPMGYTPPNKKYVCEYIKHWLQVKVIWILRITPKESAAILKNIESEHCDPADFRMTTGDLMEQRHFMEDNADLCQRPELQTHLAVGF